MFSLIGNTFGSIWFLSLAWHVDVWWIFEFEDNLLMLSNSSFCCTLDIHTGAYFPFTLRSLIVVGLCGYPWSWLLRCLIDVNRWLIDVDRCLVGDVTFFVVYHISILGHIPLLIDEVWLGSSTRMNDRCWSFTSWLWHQILYWGIFPPSSLSILGIEVVANLISDWALVWDFRWFMISGPSYMVLLR